MISGSRQLRDADQQAAQMVCGAQLDALNGTELRDPVMGEQPAISSNKLVDKLVNMG